MTNAYLSGLVSGLLSALDGDSSKEESAAVNLGHRNAQVARAREIAAKIEKSVAALASPRDESGERIEGCEIGASFIRDNLGKDYSLTVKLPSGKASEDMLGRKVDLILHPRELTE